MHGRVDGWMCGWLNKGWLNKTGRLGAATPVITQNFVSQTTHDVDLTLVAEEGKYLIHK